MTELAYLRDVPAGYVRSFRTHVSALPPGAVVLATTYFFPGGGGQPPDRGTMRCGAETFEVVDVGRSGTAVLHRLRRGRPAGSVLSVGAEVEGTLDWARRYRHMRLHTGQHLLSARIFARTGLRTAKALLSGDSAYLDLEGALPAGVERELQGDLDLAVARPHAVSISHVARSEWEAHPAAPRTGLVPLPAHVDPVRVVEIESEDACPCGGTHLRSTGEIGTVRLRVDAPTNGVARARVVFTQVAPAIDAPAA